MKKELKTKTGVIISATMDLYNSTEKLFKLVTKGQETPVLEGADGFDTMFNCILKVLKTDDKKLVKKIAKKADKINELLVKMTEASDRVSEVVEAGQGFVTKVKEIKEIVAKEEEVAVEEK